MSMSAFARAALIGASVALGGMTSSVMAGQGDHHVQCPYGNCSTHRPSKGHAVGGVPHNERRSYSNFGHGPDRNPPYVGQRVRGNRVAWSRSYHHLPRPHAHTHYERIGTRIVLVNDNTLAVIAVVGLAAALLANN